MSEFFWREKKHTYPKLCVLSPVTAVTSEKEGGMQPPSFFPPWEKDDGKFNKSMTRGKKHKPEIIKKKETGGGSRGGFGGILGRVE